jgi:broad specificity phosphatase PhoE
MAPSRPHRQLIRLGGWLVVLASTVGLSACSKSTPAVAEPETIILLVRHAERSSAPGADPPLSAAGEARARELLHVARGANVKKVYASEYQRARQTVQPLADAVGLTVDSSFRGPDLAPLVKDILTNHRGQTILIAHHSNTVPELIRLLGGGEVRPINDAAEFDRLYVVHSRKGDVTVTALRYGAEYQK